MAKKHPSFAPPPKQNSRSASPYSSESHGLCGSESFKSHHEDSNIVIGLSFKGMLHECFCGCLCIRNMPHEVDRPLIACDIPKLQGRTTMNTLKQRHPTGLLTPSHARIRNSSSLPNSVSVVYGLPTTYSFILLSPRLRVTAKTPFTRPLITNPPASVIRFASCLSLPLWS